MKNTITKILYSGVFCIGIVCFSLIAKAENATVKEMPQQAASEDEIPTVTAKKEDLLQARPYEKFFGDVKAPVLMIEYASLSCSHCATFHNKVFPFLQKEYIETGKVRYIFRHFPLDEPALRAAQVINCATDEKREKFLTAFFRTQSNWTTQKNYLEILSNIAKLGGMAGETFDTCIADKEGERKIMLQRLEAAQVLNLRSTPSFLIEGEIHEGARDIEYFRKVLDGALKKKEKSAVKQPSAPHGEQKKGKVALPSS